MAYVKYEGLHNPNEVLEKIAEYVKSRGYTITSDVSDDLNIYDMSTTDGKKFVFMDRTNTYYILMRTANGVNIFGSDDATMDVTTKDTDATYYGLGMTVSEGYSSTQRWYNQYQTPNTLNGTYINGVYIPVNDRTAETTHLYTLYCNNITTPSDVLTFSVVAENTNGDALIGHDYKAVHLIVGMLYKYDTWTGGIFFSGSSVPSLMKQAAGLFTMPPAESTAEAKLAAHFITDDSGILPVLSSGAISNTFLRINIDDAIKTSRGNIHWASSGTDNVTGKPLSLPIRVGSGGNGIIPNYYYMQSSDNLDWGKNINTLNCITLNLPIYFAVQVDPDVLKNYAPVGQPAGLYYVCMLNMQTAGTYEMSYPTSGDLCQVFSFSSRRGKYGFDGLSIRQSEDDT